MSAGKSDKICSFCGNRNVREAVVQYVYRRDGRFLIVNNVPCEKCEYCGEQYFRADTLKRIEREFDAVHLRGKRASAEIRVPVEQF